MQKLYTRRYIYYEVDKCNTFSNFNHFNIRVTICYVDKEHFKINIPIELLCNNMAGKTCLLNMYSYISNRYIIIDLEFKMLKIYLFLLINIVISSKMRLVCSLIMKIKKS